ncbi:hypothetical protein AX16_003318 [Volvariella volvacea WC 439]|nr:hypothetical protein AX16_003318 [Volvariella volvacea WC 439]
MDLAEWRDDEEMRVFIRSRFSTIFVKHRDILQFYSSDGVWTSDHNINLITFHGVNSHDRLQACLEQVPEALSPLDALYTQIMQDSHSPNDREMQDILLLTCGGSSPLVVGDGTLNTLAIVTNLGIVECQLRLRKLHSVLAVPCHPQASGSSPRQRIAVHHRSFSDFLFDAQRSGDYFVDQKKCAIGIIRRCVLRLEKIPLYYPHIFAQYWWGCIAPLSREDIPHRLFMRMKRLDFEAMLEDVWDMPYVGLQYQKFVGACLRWKAPSLINKFPQKAMEYAFGSMAEAPLLVYATHLRRVSSVQQRITTSPLTRQTVSLNVERFTDSRDRM